MSVAKFLNSKVAYVTGVRKIEGDKCGIELELEGRNVGLDDLPTRGWTRHHDGSLRGEAIEYTTTGAVPFSEASNRVNTLFKKFKDNGVKINDSIRTSTHVHLNFSDKKVKDVINFFTLFTLLEEVLQHYSGEDRKGNVFCISTREAEGIVGILVDAIGRESFDRFAGDRYKYAACNLSTLFKFGTIEVRTMRGASSAEQVNTWLSILENMYHYALKMTSPADLVRDLSQLGAEALLRLIFSGPNYSDLMRTFPAPKTLHYSLMEGARILQVFAYQYDDEFKAEVKEDPEPKNREGDLPVVITQGAWRGLPYVIYKPNGDLWNCRPAQPHAPFWTHGMLVCDEPRIKFDAGLGRFVGKVRDGRWVPCRWHRHHAIPDEGRPDDRLPLAFRDEDMDFEDADFEDVDFDVDMDDEE